MAVPSYAHGASAVPLLGETIGENLRRTVEQHGDREALVVRSQGYRATYRELWDADRPGRARPAGARRPDRATASASGRRTATSGSSSSTPRPASARSWSTSTRPTRAAELEYVLNQSGISLLLLARAFRQSDYVGMLGGGAGALPEPARVARPRRRLGRPARRRRPGRRRRRWPSARPRSSSTTRSTSSTPPGTTGFPKGATLSHHNILNNGFFIGETLGYSAEDRVCIPVPFYHCFGMVLGNLACTTHGAAWSSPARRSTRWPCWRRSRPSAAPRCTACRRCSSPSWTTRRSSEFDLSTPADRHHGRLALPGRGDAAGPVADAHARGHDLLRHDRDLAGLHPDGARRPAREAGRHGRPGPPARRDQDRRSGHRRGRPARHAGRAVHARLQRDARLLEQRGGDPRRDRRGRAGCTPATWPRWTTRATSTSSAGSRT